MKNFILFIVTLLAIVTTASAQSNKFDNSVIGTSEWKKGAGEIFAVEAVKYVTIITPLKSGVHFCSIRALDSEGMVIRRIDFGGEYKYEHGTLCIWDVNGGYGDFYISTWGRIPVVESYN